MSDEIERMFAALSDDADHVPRVSAPELRTRTNRQGAVRTTATLAVVAVAVAGTAVGGRWLLAGRHEPLPPAPATSVAASAHPSAAPSTVASAAPTDGPSAPSAPSAPASAAQPSAPAIPKSIPARAFLTAKDLGTEEGPETTTELMLPPLCPGGLPSDAQIGVRRTVRGMFVAPDKINGVVHHTVTVYQGDGARKFLTELKAKVKACPKHGDHTFELAEPAQEVDDAFQFRSTRKSSVAEEMGGPTTGEVSVFRVGDAVAIVTMNGWEDASIRTTDVLRLNTAARRNLDAWR
jgi:hypothetical protein